MQQLANALQAAGYRSSEQLRAERDRAIAALVKARKSKRRGAKQLKARVLALVAALKVPAPIVTLLVLVMMPSLALAHLGHDGHGPDMNAGGAIVLVGVTLGLAAHAWNTWGKRRPDPEPEADAKGDDIESAVQAYLATEGK